MREDTLEKSEKLIRPELNLEKWPTIWIPAQSRSKPKLRTLERKKTLENENIILCRVEINPSLKYGNLTTEDQKVWYGLLELWEKTGRPKQLIFSLSQLAKVLKRTWSKGTWEGLKRSLMRLSISAITWVNSYYDNTTKKTLEHLDSFHIIVDLHLAQVSEEHKINNEQCTCRFSDLLYQNLVSHYTKPTFFDVVLRFKSGIAQLLYKYLELVMHDKNIYERNSKELFDDLKLEGEDYKYISRRKRILDIALPEVNGAPIFNGFLSAALVQTKDKQDWKLVVRKTAKKLISSQQSEETKRSHSKTEEQKSLPKRATNDNNKSGGAAPPLATLAAQIVTYFLTGFGLKRSNPSSKEIEHANQLISTHKLDLEKGKFIIDFSQKAAKQTDFKVQNFGGILQYVDQALATFSEIEKAQQKRKIEEQIQQAESEKMCDSLEAKLKIALSDNYEIIYEKAKEQVLANMTWLQNMQETTIFRLELYSEMEREIAAQGLPLSPGYDKVSMN